MNWSERTKQMRADTLAKIALVWKIAEDPKVQKQVGIVGVESIHRLERMFSEKSDYQSGYYAGYNDAIKDIKNIIDPYWETRLENK
jgi:hypothetical protein